MKINHRDIVLLSLIVSIMTFLSVNFIEINPSNAMVKELIANASADAVPEYYYWKGTTDQKLDRIEKDIGTIKKDIGDLCITTNALQLQAAKAGMLYGGGTGLGVYIIGLISQLFMKRKRE